MIEMQNLSFGYSGGDPLLADMTLSLQPGSFHFLTGPSGAGKTTFLRLCFADLLPTAGRMSAFGQDVRALSRDGIAGLRRRVGVVHQDPQFLDHLPVAENLLQRDFSPVAPDRARKRGRRHRPIGSGHDRCGLRLPDPRSGRAAAGSHRRRRYPERAARPAHFTRGPHCTTNPY